MKRNLTLVLFIFIFSLQAQTVSWHKVLHGQNQLNPSMNSSAVAADENGYWASHLSKFRMSYGSVFLGNQEVLHLNLKGETDDTINIYGNANIKMIRKYGDRLYMWIGFFDSVQIDEIRYSKSNNYNSFLCYRDASGIKSLGLLPDSIAIINILPNGNIVQISGTGFGGGCTLETYSPDGSNKKSKYMESIGYVMALTPSKDNGLFITGGCLGTEIHIDSVQESNAFTYSNYVMYLDSKFNAHWMKIIEDITCQASAAGGTMGSAYWTGSTYMKPDFDGLSYTGGPTMAFTDFFTTRISNKTFQWVREVPSDTTFAQVNFGENNSTGVDEQGNFYALGVIRGNPVHWDSKSVTGSYKNNYNIILASWDPSGKMRWVRDFGGTGYDMGLELHVKGVDNLFFSAVVTDTFEMDGNTIPARYGDIMVVKIGEENNTGVNNISLENTLQFYPNPGNGIVQHNARITTNYLVSDMAGRQVQSGVMKPGIPFDLGKLPNGMYTICGEKFAVIYLKSQQ